MFYNVKVFSFATVTVAFILFSLVLSLFEFYNFYENLIILFSGLMCLLLVINAQKRMSSVFLMLFGLKLVLIPMFVKVIFFEEMTLNMKNVDTTPYLLMFSMLTFLLFSSFLKRWRVRSACFGIHSSDRGYKVFSFALFAIGYLFLFLHMIFRPSLIDGGGQEGFGGFGNLTSIVYLGVIVYLYRERDSTLSINKPIIIMAGLMLFMSLMSNTKHEIITFILAIGLSIVFFNIKVRGTHVFVGFLTVLFLLVIIVPTIQKTRTLEFRQASVEEKFSILFSSPQHQNRSPIAGGFLPVESSMVDRLDILTETDIIVNGVERYGYVGYYPIYDAIPKVLPTFIVGQKNPAASSDRLLWDIKHRRYGIISRMTPGMVASIYAVSGFKFFFPLLGLLIVIFILPLIFLFGNNMSYNIWAVFIVTKYGLYFTEKPADALVALLLRDLPLTVFQVILISKILGYLGTHVSLKGNLKWKV